jgi:UDP-N-acetylmuramoylalanine--D-glutamate ligase
VVAVSSSSAGIDEIAMGLAGKRIVVVGLARSGVAAADYLARQGARVVATDGKAEADLPQEVLKLLQRGVELELGGHRRETFTSADMAVVSPGVPWDMAELQQARAAGVDVMAELELGFRLLKGTVAAITGTKGKSTTTAALGAMLKEKGGDVRVGGNIGLPVCALLDGATDQTQWVLEVSSFQLEGTRRFHPHLAVYLNLAADHLDRHASFEEYAAAKARIFTNQTPDDWAVVNADDPHVLAAARSGRARLVPFHVTSAAAPEGAFLEGQQARLRRAGREETLFERSDVRVPGEHLALDLMVAGTAARILGATTEQVRAAVRSFRGVAHVLEHVADVGGVAFYNDSKATNVEAARRSIEAFPSRVVVILGGRYKGGDFAELAGPLAARGSAVVAMGEAAPRVEEALAAHVAVARAATLAEAVTRAFASARAGDTVLLAPACSSFDMFKDYAERGDAFKAEVQRLVQQERNEKPQRHGDTEERK